MATVMDRGAMTTVGRPGVALPSRLPITLSDLSTVIQDVVGSEDDGLGVATVVHLLRSGRITDTGLGTGGIRHRSTEARRWLCVRSPGWRARSPRESSRSITGKESETCTPNHCSLDT
jgi:hypothetical protein